MYRNAQINIRANGTFADDFHHLLIRCVIIVLGLISREIKSACPEGLLYADDLTLVSESLEDLKGKLEAWKEAWESKGSRVNAKIMKIRVSNKNAEKIT